MRQKATHFTILVIVLIGALPHLAWAQARHVLSGTVRGTDGTALPGATVAIPVLGLGTAIGFFSSFWAVNKYLNVSLDELY